MLVCTVLICAAAPLSEVIFFIPWKFFRILNWPIIGLIDVYNFILIALKLRSAWIFVFCKNLHIDLDKSKMISWISYLPAILKCGMAFICAIWMHKDRTQKNWQRVAIWWISKYNIRAIISLRGAVVQINFMQGHDRPWKELSIDI